MGYYEAFRRPQIRPLAHSSSGRLWARGVHLSLAVSLVLLPPYGFVIGPGFVMLTEGERSHLVDQEALDAFNYAITAALVLAVVDALSLLIPTDTGVATAVALFRLVYVVVGVGLAWQAQKKVGDRKPYNLSLRLVKPVWTHPDDAKKT